jgi:hypothetical protein
VCVGEGRAASVVGREEEHPQQSHSP